MINEEQFRQKINRWNRRKPKVTPVLKCKRVSEDAILPTRGSDWSAGLDFYSMVDVEIQPGDIVGFHTGWAMEIPRGFFGHLVTRSSLGKNGVRIAAGANVIDSDYRGEVIAYMINDGIYPRHVGKGDRFAQIVIIPCSYLDAVEVDELSETERGTGGFGSTGR